MVEKAKKTAVAKKVHIDNEGKESRSASAAEDHLEIRFLESDGKTVGKVLSIGHTMLSNDMWIAAGWHGLAQKLGDTYADAKKKGLVPFDEAEAMLEQIMAGNWVAESLSTGPRIGLLVEAVMAAKAEAGMEADEATIKEKLADKDYAKSVKANEQVNAHYKRLEAERAVARSKEAAKAAKAADTDALADI